MGHWLYTLATTPFSKVANGPFKRGLQHRFGFASPGAGHLCGKQLPGAKQPCKAPLDAIGRHVAWCARRARESRRNRMRDFLVEYVKTTGAIATSEQAMPLPRDSQPAARETRAVHTADIHISEPNGTDIWVDVRVGMAKPNCSVPKEITRMEQEKRREYGQGSSNPRTLFDGVVPVIFEQHGCPSPCAITFPYHRLRRRVAKLEQCSHLPPCILLVMHHQMFQECSPYCPDAGLTSRIAPHGGIQCLFTAQLPRGAVARCCSLARPGIAAESCFHPRGG